MKNIHLIPTEKPSRLHYSKVKSSEGISYKLILNQEESKCDNGLLSGQRHIYITSDEEIKEGDWLFANQGVNKIVEIKEGNYPYGSINNKGDKIFNSKHWKSKIILTTDPELIADGVQAIDDEFLEWFVKNPSCEKVKVSELRFFNPDTNESAHCKWEYDLPQEEPKQETLEEILPKNSNGKYSRNGIEKAFELGAKWQAERMYSEEDLRNAYRWGTTVNNGTKEHFNEWFEQFKKK